MAGLTIGAHTFASKTAATKFYRGILQSYRPGQRLSEADAQAILDLLQRHPEGTDKIGCGVDYVFVKRDKFGGQCFNLARSDGSRTDFSYLVAVNGKAPPAKTSVCQGLRRAIRDQIFAALDRTFANADANGRVMCDLTGEDLTRGEGHVDHKPPHIFDLLAHTFICVINGLDWDDVPLKWSSGDSPEIDDTQLVAAWRAYHADYAELQFIRGYYNLIRSKQ